MLSSNNPQPIGVTHRRAVILPLDAPDRRSLARVGSPRSSSLAYHLESLLAPRALGIALETDVDTLQITQVMLNTWLRSFKLKLHEKTLTAKVLNGLLNPLLLFLLHLQKLDNGFLGQADLHP